MSDRLPSFIVLIKDPKSRSLLGWCFPGKEFADLRERYIYLLMEPLVTPVSDLQGNLVHCSIATIERYQEVGEMLDHHERLQKEREMDALIRVTPGLLDQLDKLVAQEKEKR